MYHPSKGCVPVMMVDEGENALVFPNYDSALAWVNTRNGTPYAYAIIDASELDFENV
jgi:hypothetical protein